MENINIENKHNILPILPLRGLCIFPGMLFHFDVGRKKSVKAVEAAMAGDAKIFLAAQKHLKADDPAVEDIYTVGTVATIRQILKLPNEVVRVLVEGESRGVLSSVLENNAYMIGDIELVPGEPLKAELKKDIALLRKLQDSYSEYASISGMISDEVFIEVVQSDDLARLSDYICQNIHIAVDSKQEVLEQLDPRKRAAVLIEILSDEADITELENRIQDKVKQGIDKHQRDYYLREQIKVINEELGEGEDTLSESMEYKKKIYALGLEAESEKRLMKEASRLGKMHSSSPESAVIRTYLDTCLDLPWGKVTKENLDIVKAKATLERDHFGMEKVKERILELFAVRAMQGQIKGQVICLAGPPGVGKTSIASSIARSMGRKFSRLSLGGVRDEAEIRGHRKTYIGAMPGRFVTALRQAGSSNCVILVDEIDKLGNDYKGDPNAALLEVFDTEQNNAFRDHYVELPVDLSGVIFICTANNIENIPRPLLDRMELIELGSYTDVEKAEIAKKHLLPKQRKKHGLTAASFKISDEAMMEMIDSYTRESGVRTLERTIAKLCRKSVRKLYEKQEKTIKITPDQLKEYLGSPKYKEDKENLKLLEVGVINGLAYTSVGGELLQIEANITKGTGKQEVTGNLGDVMKESVKAAITYIRTRTERLGISEEFYAKSDIHVHFPEAAVPKDGPSAGIGITCALISALTNTAVPKTYAMTGEVTIRGRVMAIGGLREKTMAAYRNGIKTIIVPEDNRSDIEELDNQIKDSIEFIFVRSMDKILDILFSKVEKNEDKLALLPVEASNPVGLRQ